MLKNKKYLKKAVGAAAISASLAACSEPYVATASVDARSAFPTRSTTSLTQALACLDNQLVARGGRSIQVAVGHMPDTTGKISVSMRDMTIDSILQANRRSKAFRVIDQARHGIDAQILRAHGGIPQPSLSGVTRSLGKHGLNITGSITQVSEGDRRSTADAGLDTSNGGVGLRYLHQISSMSTHMRLSSMPSGVVQYSAKQEVSMRKVSGGLNLLASFPGAGAVLGFSVDRSDSASKAVETMVHLQVIELLGKAAGVPYWECLQHNVQTRSAAESSAKSWRSMSDRERAADAKLRLAKLGYGGNLSDALQSYQLAVGQNPTGRLDFATYNMLLQEKPRSTSLTGPKLSLSKHRDAVRLKVNLAADGYVDCYYQAADGVIAKIYPNPFQAKERLSSGSEHSVPNAAAAKAFQIEAAPRGKSQSFICLATPSDMSAKLPRWTRPNDFRDLRAYGVERLADIGAAYQRAGSVGTSTIKYSGR